jgi:UDP-N-acetylglucosamine acyltransferase
VSNQIHSTAVVSARAVLGKNNTIGPFVVIEDDVMIGDGNVIASHAIIKRFTTLGNDNHIHEHTVLGGWPQHTAFKNGDVQTFCQIGNGNVFREAVTVNRAYHEGKTTVMGDRNFLMFSAHIGHDCVIGNDVTFAPSAGIGGHVVIGNKAFISGGVMVHQFCHIGRFAMVGGNSKITQDVLPFMITDGNPATVRGLNMVGLKRAGFSLDDIKALKSAFQSLFQPGKLQDNLDRIGALAHPLADELRKFVQEADRGFHRTR